MEPKEEGKINKEEAFERALKAFWRDFTKTPVIKGAHTEISVEPKMIVAGKINPQVAQRLLAVYLSQVTPEQILNDEVTVTPNEIVIRDKKGRIILEITDPEIIDAVSNEVTGFVGLELANRENPEGAPYLPVKRGQYSFGDIKEALIDFMLDQERNDSRNLLKDATLILLDESNATELTHPDKNQN